MTAAGIIGLIDEFDAVKGGHVVWRTDVVETTARSSGLLRPSLLTGLPDVRNTLSFGIVHWVLLYSDLLYLCSKLYVDAEHHDVVHLKLIKPQSFRRIIFLCGILCLEISS